MTFNFSKWWNGAGWASLMSTIVICFVFIHGEYKELSKEIRENGHRIDVHIEQTNQYIAQVNQRIDDVNKRSDDLHKEFFSLLKEMNKKHS